MKNYRVTVNGVAYDVCVEEINGTTAPAAAPAAPKEEPEATISFEDVRKILSAKSSAEDGKYKAEAKALVAKYSDNGTLKGVPESSYAALIAEAEVIGNG